MSQIMVSMHSATLTSQNMLFGRTVTPAERLRQHQRSLQKAQRELERERAKLEQQEKKTMADIKKNAKSGNMVGGGVIGAYTECVQDPRKGPGPHTEVHAKVHPDAGAAPGRVVAHADAPEQ